jgi:hypothetical protein
VTPLDPAVVLGGPRPDELVHDAGGPEERLDAVRVAAAVSGFLLSERLVGELAVVVRLKDLGAAPSRSRIRI